MKVIICLHPKGTFRFTYTKNVQPLCTRMPILRGKFHTRLCVIAAMTLTSLMGSDSKTITMLGSMLFLRSVSGTRVITGSDVKDVAGCKFEG